MEKYGFVKVLKGIKEIVSVKQVTTDRHTQIKKHMRENERDIDHQFDIWHLQKSIKKKLTALAKKEGEYQSNTLDQINL